MSRATSPESSSTTTRPGALSPASTATATASAATATDRTVPVPPMVANTLLSTDGPPAGGSDPPGRATALVPPPLTGVDAGLLPRMGGGAAGAATAGAVAAGG